MAPSNFSIICTTFSLAPIYNTIFTVYCTTWFAIWLSYESASMISYMLFTLAKVFIFTLYGCESEL